MAAVNLVIRASESPGSDRVNIYFHSRDMRFQNLGKIQHESCQFCAPYNKNCDVTSRENSYLWTEIDTNKW